MSKRLLVIYGYDLKEKFAAQVGREFAQLDTPDVVTARLRGIRGYNRVALMRRDIAAKYAIDLHDDSTAPQRLSPKVFAVALENELKVAPNEKYMIVGHMGYNHAMRLLKPFAKKWNERRRRL